MSRLADARSAVLHRFGRRAYRIAPVLLPLALVLAASATGCEAIVGSSVPAVRCADSDPASCPTGQVCATAIGQCIPANKSCLVNPCAPGLTCDPGTLECVTGVVEAGTNDSGPGVDSGPGKDSGPGVDASDLPPYPVGHGCQKPSDCATTLCADSAILGADYFAKVGAVCTIPCCTSEQCGAGLVCIGPGTGGKYCVPAKSLNRTLGTKAGGAVCALDRDCRSGKCLGDSGGLHKVCADSCCSDANCAGTPADATQAAKCRPVDVDGNTHKSYACSVLIGGSVNLCPVAGPVDSCISGVCASGTCTKACCSLATQSGGTLCDAQNLANGDTFNFSNGGGTGGNDFGAPCSLGTKCLSGYCDKADGAMSGFCSDICCTDTDCGPPRTLDGGTVTFVCRPRTGMTHFLRCVPQ